MEAAQGHSSRGKPQLSLVCGCSRTAQALAAPPRSAPIPTELPAPPAAAGCGFRRLGWGYTQAWSLPGSPGQRDQALTPPKTLWDPRQPIPRGTWKGSGANLRWLPAADSAQDVAFHLTYIWWELWEGKGFVGLWVKSETSESTWQSRTLLMAVSTVE